ncbi:MAG TPA: hypothetical protein VGO00_23100 [Kofleriaceae bacterium]|nr:hypothetical protein [Kofleriaceae bacterium]
MRGSTPPGDGPLRQLARHPGVQLVIGGVILAVAFPSNAGGSIGLMILTGALGIAVMKMWPRAPEWLRAPTQGTTTWIVISIVAVTGIATFSDALTLTPDWQMGDWGPQRAALAHIMPSLPGLHVPVWNHVVSTGDAPLDLYPALTYIVTGHLALLLGLANDLPRALMVMAVLVHVSLAITTALLAMRLTGKPIALVIGLFTLVDSGAVAHGGTVGLFHWALLHSALALLFGTIAALGVIGALRRPRIASSLAIWIGTALATATHPAALIGAAASSVALLAVALLASDVPPRRALVGLGHIVIGVALGAVVWMPMTARILDYGQHFPNIMRTPGQLLENLLQAPSPVTAWGMVVYAGYFGIIAGLWSRRAVVVFVAATALVLLVGLCDAPYLALDLAPGRGVARLGTERLAQLARPFVFAAAGYGMSVVFGHAIRAWHGAKPRQRMIAAAVIGVMTGAVVRAIPVMWRSATNRAIGETQVIAPDPDGRMQLEVWALARMHDLGPGRWARALFEEDTHEHMHLTVATGLPSFHLPPLPDMLLRERMEDVSKPSLRRFNVRWAIAIGHSPAVGDPDTEKQLGTYRIREVTDWDGKFARIERGTGTVETTRLDDEAVEIEVTADAPVLVALGTGYYPRWRATHADGSDEPVYAMPSTPTANLHVVSAWVKPGHTTFTCDGPLPSDHDGRFLSILAAVLAIAAITAWQRQRWRVRILRRVAALRARAPAAARIAVSYGVPLLVVVLIGRSCVVTSRPALALEVGSGIRGTATVEARLTGGAWETCSYDRLPGEYRCDGLVKVYDAMTQILNDVYPSWPFVTPAIVAAPDRDDVEIRVRLHERLSGTYWAAVGEGTAEVSFNGDLPRKIERKEVIELGDADRTIEIDGHVGAGWSFTFVGRETVEPDRSYLVAPPSRMP